MYCIFYYAKFTGNQELVLSKATVIPSWKKNLLGLLGAHIFVIYCRLPCFGLQAGTSQNWRALCMCTSCHWAIAHSIGFASGYGGASAACQPFGLRVIASPLLEICLNLQEPLVRKAPPISIGQARSPWHWGPVLVACVMCSNAMRWVCQDVFPCSDSLGDLHSEARRPFCMRRYMLYLMMLYA